MSQRQDWRDFICDPKRAGRHLANIGRAVLPSEAPLLGNETLAGFLEKLRGGEADVSVLASVIDLLAGGYEDFCARKLPQLLDSLANERTGESATVGPMMRGAIRWDLTSIGRLSGRLIPAQFISRLPVRSFALPENALVRWLIEELARTVRNVERRVGSSALPPQFTIIRDGCKDALSHEWFREVAPPRLLEQQMRLAAGRQRLPAYRLAAQLAARRERYQTGDRAARWRHALELLAANWLEPISSDDLFELYALVFVIDVLEIDLRMGSAAQYDLTALGREYVAVFEAEIAGITVFFDQSPTTMLGCPSYQLEILAAHQGIRGTSRRPDVIVVREDSKRRRVCFVEVKRTAESAYISDSIYKAFGYISDFRAIWEKESLNPKVVLLFPENVSPRPGLDLSQQEVVLASATDRSTLAVALRSALGL